MIYMTEKRPSLSYRTVSAALWVAAALSWAPAVPAEEQSTVQLTARNGRFYPETLHAPAGRTFSLMVTNEGPGPEEFESFDLRKEQMLAPGVTTRIEFAPLRPGIYRFFGDFHQATAKGEIVAE